MALPEKFGSGAVGSRRGPVAKGRLRLGEFLLQEKLVDVDDLKRALVMQKRVGGRLGTNLLELGCVSEEPLLQAIGRQQAMSTVSRWQLNGIAPEVINLLPPKLARRYLVVPFRVHGKTLYIASMDSGEALIEDEVAHLTTSLARTFIGLEVRILEALESYYQLERPTRFAVVARRLGSATPLAKPQVDDPELLPSIETLLRGGEAAKEIATPPAETARPKRERGPESAAAILAASAVAKPDDQTPLPSPAARLQDAAAGLLGTTIREEIADLLLAFCGPYFRRRLLFFKRGDRVLGWRGEGEAVDAQAFRSFTIPADEPSVFLSLAKGAELWRGPLARLPAHARLLASIGGRNPRECLVLPITLRSKVVSFLYGDNMRAGLADVPLPELRRLVSKAGVALEVCVLKNKIRTL
jgi:hypothetical protein